VAARSAHWCAGQSAAASECAGARSCRTEATGRARPDVARLASSPWARTTDDGAPGGAEAGEGDPRGST
jgi:hypothetical protein